MHSRRLPTILKLTLGCLLAIANALAGPPHAQAHGASAPVAIAAQR